MPRVPPQKCSQGQKALVTGANSGIGKAIAIALGEAGADVVVNYVAGEDRRSAGRRARSQAHGSRAIAIKADVSEEDEVAGDVRARCSSEFGTIDILVNNAGLQQDAPFERDDARAVEHGASAST